MGVSLAEELKEFNGVKVFAATMVADRDQLGEKVTHWINTNLKKQVTDIVVTQSSDAAFHCVAITVFYYEDLNESPNEKSKPEVPVEVKQKDTAPLRVGPRRLNFSTTE